ncbi:MAG: M20/M25/M40 family metallo-hydrolase [Gemmatimonadetes bacterium]|nr:M20/M25/M40 family metallo-hydrolase [Gemmatimonadota bacterium]
MRLTLIPILAISATLSLRAQPVLTPAQVRGLLTALAHDSMAGRATGTPGAAKAARLIADAMQRAGIAPAGDSGYFQRVALVLDATTGRGGRAGGPPVRRQSFRVLPSLADLDTVPAARHTAAVNVVGIIRGNDPSLAAEHVLVDAHYDHIGIGTPVNGDSIYNGADDDASGTVAVLEVARQIAAGPPPRRTIVFMTTIGEERGLLGTRWYIAHPLIPLSQMVANLEIEMIGRPDSLAGGSGRAWLTGYERSTMGDGFAAAGIPIVPDKRPDQQFFQRSDNIAFARIGIPAHTLSSFNLHTDYHRPSDDVDKVDFDHMTAVINAAARAVRLLSDGPKPEWKPGGRP